MNKLKGRYPELHRIASELQGVTFFKAKRLLEEMFDPQTAHRLAEECVPPGYWLCPWGNQDTTYTWLKHHYQEVQKAGSTQSTRQPEWIAVVVEELNTIANDLDTECWYGTAKRLREIGKLLVYFTK